MRCLDCEYNLEGLQEHRCPECGRAFDPNDPLSFEGEMHAPTFGERVIWIVYGCIVVSGTLIAIAIVIAVLLHLAGFGLIA